MISAFAVPQFGQVIVDSKITGRRSREHETEHDQNRAEGENARHESGHDRACACDTRRARHSAATTPKQHSAAASEADDGNGEQREPMRRGEPCHSNQPHGSKSDRTE
jgi:hypothetical protein